MPDNRDQIKQEIYDLVFDHTQYPVRTYKKDPRSVIDHVNEVLKTSMNDLKNLPPEDRLLRESLEHHVSDPMEMFSQINSDVADVMEGSDDDYYDMIREHLLSANLAGREGRDFSEFLNTLFPGLAETPDWALTGIYNNEDGMANERMFRKYWGMGWNDPDASWRRDK